MIQHLKAWNFFNIFYYCGSFLPSWIRIRIPNTGPDPLARLNLGPIGIRIRNPASHSQKLSDRRLLLVYWRALQHIQCRQVSISFFLSASVVNPDPDLYIQKYFTWPFALGSNPDYLKGRIRIRKVTLYFFCTVGYRITPVQPLFSLLIYNFF